LSAASIKSTPETLSVTFEEFSPTYDFFDYRGTKVKRGRRPSIGTMPALIFQVATELLVDVDARTESVRVPGLDFCLLFVTLTLNVVTK
jgi:hypothetical protein